MSAYAPRKGKDPVAALEQLAHPLGFKVVARGHGHFQLTGAPLLVNWWPLSKRSTAYVDGTREGVAHATAQMVLDMATKKPKYVGSGDERSHKSTRKWKKRELAKDPRCHWCGCQLTLENATKDHVIPLARGGLDNHNNAVLACEPCNKSRGHDMPELEKPQTQLQEQAPCTSLAR